MSFYRETTVKAVRKARRCLGCGRMIAVGETALDVAGYWDGDFWSGTFHHECRAAEIALNRLYGPLRPDEWMQLGELEWDDWEWLLAEYPVVAARKGITAERLQEVKDERARIWNRRTPNGDPQ